MDKKKVRYHLIENGGIWRKGPPPPPPPSPERRRILDAMQRAWIEEWKRRHEGGGSQG